MAMNYASKYESKVQERFKLGSQTNMAVNSEYEFVGVNAINVYTIPTTSMNDYTMTGANRYGSPSELGNTVQTMTLSKDRSFTFTIDRRNWTDTMMVMEAGKALRRQIDEVVIPEIDTYRISKIVAGAGTAATPAPITKTNAYTAFLDGVATLLENKVPMAGTFAYISTNFYKMIRQDPAFIKASDMAQDMLVRGAVGMIEGVTLIHLPSAYLPADVEFVITNQIATLAAEKLADYKIHENPPGIDGWLVEGRIYYDAFILDTKKKAIYVHKSA
ncbi:MAG: N4-gp56 family major capsid protein [Sarcina sp.]